MAKLQQHNDFATQALVWLPLIIIVVSLITAMVMRSGVEEIAQDSTEIVATTHYLDSATSLKTIIATLNSQYIQAEDSWSSTLSTVLFLLFVVSVIAIIQWIRLYQHSRRQPKK